MSPVSAPSGSGPRPASRPSSRPGPPTTASSVAGTSPTASAGATTGATSTSSTNTTTSATTSPPSSHPPPYPGHNPRGRLVSRACDRCRRRKAKCEYLNTLDSCTHCRDAHVQCTFDLPLARRGPKARKRSDAAALPTPDVASLSAAPGQQVPLPPGLGFNNTAPSSGLPYAGNSVSPDATWDPPEPIDVDPSLSPHDVRNGSVSTGSVGASPSPSTRQRWLHLSQTLALRNLNLEPTVRHCLDLFFEYLYPLTPLVYEPALREVLVYIFSQQPSGMNHTTPEGTVVTPGGMSDSWPTYGHPTRPGGGTSRLAPWADSTFSLVTAVCAEAAYMLPKDIFPEGESFAEIFLQASRDCLHHHLEADLENPSANSIAIRYFHSNCLHAIGKPKYSWHIFGEAIRLAQVMHLHDESSLESLLPIEAELRRRCFWILYLGDKSAAILNNRPITIHKFCFEAGITTAYPTGIENESSMGPSPGRAALPSDTPRRTFIAGFNANVRLWQSAADLLLEIRVLQDQIQNNLQEASQTDGLLGATERQHLDSLYVRFITCLDDLPPWLQSYANAAAAGGGQKTTESNQFIIQCANLQVTLHCLRMVITQKFEDLSYFAPGVEHADLRKSEIVRDMLRVMQDAPFWALQANGEPNVEKIRLVGASLLAIIHRNQDSPLATRARGDFTVLLDVLTRLDSKASDSLRSDSTTVA